VCAAAVFDVQRIFLKGVRSAGSADGLQDRVSFRGRSRDLELVGGTTVLMCHTRELHSHNRWTCSSLVVSADHTERFLSRMVGNTWRPTLESPGTGSRSRKYLAGYCQPPSSMARQVLDHQRRRWPRNMCYCPLMIIAPAVQSKQYPLQRLRHPLAVPKTLYCRESAQS
jgi:hypothetical protein